MTTVNMSYDHPTYRVSSAATFACAAGANAVSANKFVAFANLLIKSATVVVVTAGTSAGAGNGVILKSITASGTTTTALATASMGTNTAGVSTNLVINSGTGTLAQGESITFTNGTDATGANLVCIEYQLVPGASVTA